MVRRKRCVVKRRRKEEEKRRKRRNCKKKEKTLRKRLDNIRSIISVIYHFITDLKSDHLMHRPYQVWACIDSHATAIQQTFF